MAIGNPLGLSSSFTEGIISALNRQEPEGNNVVLANAIQTSAAINPGNSGGALVDLNGQVIGIPTLAAADPQLGGAAAGIGFAIPSNVVKSIAGQLVANGKVTSSGRAYLGVKIADTGLENGVYITSVLPNTAAVEGGAEDRRADHRAQRHPDPRLERTGDGARRAQAGSDGRGEARNLERLLEHGRAHTRPVSGRLAMSGGSAGRPPRARRRRPDLPAALAVTPCRSRGEITGSNPPRRTRL